LKIVLYTPRAIGWNETVPKRVFENGLRSMSMRFSTAQSLQLWHDVALAQVRDDEPDLSVRQISILLTIYLEAPPHTVRDLAKKLNVSKPVITRALDSMGKLGLVARRRDEADMRNVLVQRTVKGALYLERLSDLIQLKADQV
jgi:DNA-binding MarR family transcriptional regulator